ncbi:hypothetical protein INR49_030407 [Caranx melampygus]|nr:hypothetical protein INR49_030407 [Caranx melampygus]
MLDHRGVCVQCWLSTDSEVPPPPPPPRGDSRFRFQRKESGGSGIHLKTGIGRPGHHPSPPLRRSSCYRLSDFTQTTNPSSFLLTYQTVTSPPSGVCRPVDVGVFDLTAAESLTRIVSSFRYGGPHMSEPEETQPVHPA